MYNYNQIANEEFGMDYYQLAPNEREWVRDFYTNIQLIYKLNTKSTG